MVGRKYLENQKHPHWVAVSRHELSQTSHPKCVLGSGNQNQRLRVGISPWRNEVGMFFGGLEKLHIRQKLVWPMDFQPYV